MSPPLRHEPARCRNWSEYPDIAAVIRRIREIDTFCFGTLQTEDWGTAEGWLAIARKNPHMNICLEVDGVIMGSVHWLWLNRHGRDLILSGQLRDGQIRPEHTVGTPPLDEPVYLYLLSMMVHPASQGHGYLRKLWNHVTMEHAEWTKKGVQFAEAYATAWSEAGQSILTSAGGRPVGSDGFGHGLFQLPVPIRKLQLKDDPKTTSARPHRLSIHTLFPDVPLFQEINLNDMLRERCPVRPVGAPAWQEALDRLHAELGAPSYGGWMEDREWMWTGSYMTPTKKFTHLGIDVYLPHDTPIQLPFPVTVLDTFYDKDDEVGWGGRLTVQRHSGSPAIVLGHLQTDLPPVGTKLPAHGPFGKLATWPMNGNVFEHLHIQLIRPALLPTLDWRHLDGYGFRSQAADFPHPFETVV